MANLTVKNDSIVAEIREIRITANGPVAQYAGCVRNGEYVSVPLKRGSTYNVAVTFDSPQKFENESRNVQKNKDVRMNSDEEEVSFND